MKKKWWVSGGLSLTMLGLVYTFSHWIFYVQLGVGQVMLFFKPIALERYQATSEEEKAGLNALPKVLAYAEKLGLEADGAYETIFPDKTPLLWVVSASYPDTLKPFRWTYPWLGELSYRGYFFPNMAYEEAQKLRKQGFHVRVRTVSAWSSLGYFSEVMSPSIFSDGVGAMAETVLHELFHRWYYLSGEDAWNENLAQHFGQHAALDFLKEYEGENGLEYQKYVDYLHDQEQWQTFLKAEASQFDTREGAFYLEPGDAVFWKIRARARRLPFQKRGKGQQIWRHHLPNLADFTTARQYFLWSDYLKEDLQERHQGNLMQQMRYWKEKNDLPPRAAN